jgi:hypothetical protein
MDLQPLGLLSHTWNVAAVKFAVVKELQDLLEYRVL